MAIISLPNKTAAVSSVVYICRLGSSSVLTNLSRFPVTLSTAKYAQASVPKVTFKKYEEPEELHHDIRNARFNRPMSPHLTIYEYQLTSMLSITHRATGSHGNLANLIFSYTEYV